MKSPTLLITAWIGLLCISCSRTHTVYTSGFSEEAFAEIVPEMKQEEVLNLLGEPFSRNFVDESGRGNAQVYTEDWLSKSSRPRVWRYSRQGEPRTKWYIWQVMLDDKAGRVITKDSYLSQQEEVQGVLGSGQSDQLP